ncbi:hypothetical protein CRYUN_Cryun39dG0057300 [Craigia yunnanensis]
MAEALVSFVLEHLIAVISQGAIEQVKLVLGAEKAIQKLTYNLQELKLVLKDAETREVKPRETAEKNWLDKLRGVSYDVEDILDEWNTAFLKSETWNSSSRNPVCCSFPSTCFPFGRVVVNREIAIKIKGVNERVDEITREKDKYQFKLARGTKDFERDKDDRIVACKMHEIVHDLAQFLRENECVMLKMKKLRSLPIESRNTDSLVIDLALPQVFSQLTCFRTLDLSESSFGELLEGIDNLIHFRYLKLNKNKELKELPQTLCSLFNLQTLDLSWCSSLRKLPKGIGRLINLRHLDNRETKRLRFFPRGIRRLTRLRTLSKFVVRCGGNDVEGSTVANLENMNNLQGFIDIRQLGDVRDVEEANTTGLRNKERSLQPPATLESLGIEDYGGSTVFPNWMMSLNSLKNIRLANCKNCEYLPPFGKLMFLESLQISNMGRVTKVGLEFLGVERGRGATITEEGQKSSSSSSTYVIVFPKLSHLTFEDMEEWEHWKYDIPVSSSGEETIQVMPCLCSLTLLYCPRLRSLPDHLIM